MTAPAPLTIVTASDSMRTILGRVSAVARTDTTILLVGETGVGKELFADHIHHSSRRSGGPLVKLALSALPQELLESELFGHERGAYTTAHSDKKGLFELASRGTLFLDDVDDVPLPVQAKLLRVIESQEVMRVGGTVTIPIDVRLVAASKVDLKTLVERQLFRSDLYYRLNVFPVDIPPLRQRREDVPVLVEHFLRRFGGEPPPAVAANALCLLAAYDWPGNVRELRNIVQRVALMADGEIRSDDLPAEVKSSPRAHDAARECGRCLVEGALTFGEVVTCVETTLLRQALEQSGGNQTQAAKLLGLSLSTLRDKLKKAGLNHHPHD
jgi:DNA-binding NtrC family response regulator